MPTWLQSVLDTFAWPEPDHMIRICTAIVLGGLVGLERELRDKPAGFRTIILICVGVCLFTILSETVGGTDMQHTRIAAQIVTGIGFLGAGAILRDRANILGLTTATTIWAVAAIGMAVGFGKLGLAAFGTGVILVTLLAFDVIEHWIGDLRDIQEYHIATENTEGLFDRLDKLFEDSKLRTRKRFWYQDGSLLIMHVIAMGSKTNHERLRMRLLRSNEYTLRRG